MKRYIVRNEKGEPFSKWKPAEKFAHVFAECHPIIWHNCKEEHEFHPDRKWRLDFAWPKQRVGVEIDGFGFGHQAQQNMSDDNEKRNAALTAGWRIYVYDSRLLGSKAKVADAVDEVACFLCEAN